MLDKATQKKSLIDVYPEWILNGIFKQLENYNVPWKEFVDGNTLDLDYYGNRSGAKVISPLVEKLLVDGVLSTERQAMIAQLCYQKYGFNWTKAWDAFMQEYDPLQNYKLTKTEDEEYTIDNTVNKTDNRTMNDSGTIGTSNTGTVNVADTGSSEESSSNEYNSNTKNDVYGFDSVDGVPESKSNTTQNNSSSGNASSTSNSLTTDNRKSDTVRDLEVTENKTGSETGQKTKDGSKTTEESGLIGNISYQNMLENELRVRFDWKIFDLIFRDVDKILTINIFIDNIYNKER